MTKFSQVSVFSGFNQPADISMDRRYEALCGSLICFCQRFIGRLVTLYNLPHLLVHYKKMIVLIKYS